MFAARFAAAFAVGVFLTATLPARADDYPSRPITLILPLGAGGAMDILARAQFEPKLKERLGKPLAIQKRTRRRTGHAPTPTAQAPPHGRTPFPAAARQPTPNPTRATRTPTAPH